jgi:hypothetical protein
MLGTDMLKTLLIVASSLGVITLAALLFGSWRWNDTTRLLRARLDAARVQVRPQRVDFGELDALPNSVRRYFRAVLVDGQPMIAGAYLRHRGTFNMREVRSSGGRSRRIRRLSLDVPASTGTGAS